jgi:hypothetical protein
MDEVYTIHHRMGSWLSEEDRQAQNSKMNKIKAKFGKILRKVFGRKIFDLIRRWI